MAEVKPGVRVDGAVPAGSGQGSQKKSKRKRFWAKKITGTKKKPGSSLPPKGAAEYSSNWKTLQQRMNQTTDAKKVPEIKSKIRTKIETCTVARKGDQGTPRVKPDKGAESKTSTDSRKQNSNVPSGLKPDKGAESKTPTDSRKQNSNVTRGLKPEKGAESRTPTDSRKQNSNVTHGLKPEKGAESRTPTDSRKQNSNVPPGLKPDKGAKSKTPTDSRKQNSNVPRGLNPDKGAESRTPTDSQRTSVLAKENGLKSDKGANPGHRRSEKKVARNSRGPPEKETSTQKKKRTKIEPEPAKPTGPEIWFDDVDPDDIEAAMGPEAAGIARHQMRATTGNPPPVVQTVEKMLVKDGAFEGLTKAVAMDCEMVGVGADGVDSILARVSIANQFGKCVYDKYVKPTEKVTDYRTWVSGIRPDDVKNGKAFKVVQREVASILQGRILVGHAVHNDLKILFLDHPKKKIRDTQKYKPFKAAARCGQPSLKHLCQQILKVKVQESEHSSVQDAQATMRLYTLARQRWEAELKAKHKTKKKEVAKEKPKASS